MAMPKYFRTALDTGEGSDFSIFVFDDKGAKIEKKVHKLVIRQCAYFSAMLDLKGKEAKIGKVTLDNISNETIDHVLGYLYSLELPTTLTMQQAIDVAQAADYLQHEEMKTAAVKLWQDNFVKLDFSKEDHIIDELRNFANHSLNAKIDWSWRGVQRLFTEAACKSTKWKIATESSTLFVELIAKLLGDDLPYLTADLLAEWTCASDQNLTKRQRTERKKLAAVLAKEIRWSSLSLRAIALISKREAFPMDYMVSVMQDQAVKRDFPCVGKVIYTVNTTRDLVTDLEYQNHYEVLQIVGFGTDELVWEFLTWSESNKVTVTLKSNYYNQTWDSSQRKGRVTGIKDRLQSNESIEVTVVYRPHGEENFRCHYRLDFDESDNE